MSEVGALLAGRYRLRRHLGSGAMGMVWLADDERLQRPVAVKQLLQQGAAGDAAQARERAMREGRIAARLHHPNAVAVHDVAEHDGLPLLVMEYFPAPSLAETLSRSGPLPVASAARIGNQVAAALAAAHEVGIVHRDVKPANVLLDADGTAKIVDFGIAHAGGDVKLTQTGLVAGTPAFLAPEVARGADPSPASDVFSLGALLYTAVQGSPPFGDGDGNPLALLHRVAAATIPPPDRAGPLTPLLSAVLATDPRQRPDARQVREATRAVAEGRRPPVLAPAEAEGHTQPLPPVPAPTAHDTVTSAPGAAPPHGTRLDLHPMADDPATGPSAADATAHPSAAHSGHSAPSAPPRRARGGMLALTGGALALVALVVAVLLGSGDDTGTAAAPETTTPETTSHAPRPLTEDEMRAVVTDYYALLPESSGAAWAHLGPDLRAQGRETFTTRWDDVEQVEVISQPRVTGARTVHIGIRLRSTDGTTVTEFHQHEMMRLDTAVLLRTDTLLHSETSTPPKGDEGNGENKDKGAEKDNKKKADKPDKEDKGAGDRGRGEREKDEDDD